MYASKPKWLRPGGKEPQPSAPARIHPDRRWFGNTRVIDQQKLAAFREDIQKASADPYTYVAGASYSFHTPRWLVRASPHTHCHFRSHKAFMTD